MLLGVGLFARDWDRRRAVRVGYLFLLMSPALVILAMYATDRFFMPFLPPLLILVALGWRRLEKWGEDTVSLSLPEAVQEPLAEALSLADRGPGAGPGHGVLGCDSSQDRL